MGKDLILFGLGTLMIGWQGFVVPPPDFNWMIMVAGGVLAGVPGWMQVWGLRTAGQPSLPEVSPPGHPSESSSTV